MCLKHSTSILIMIFVKTTEIMRKPKILIYSLRTQVQSDEATQEYQAMTNRSG